MSGIRAEVAKLRQAATKAADRDRRGRAAGTSSFDHGAYARLWREQQPLQFITTDLGPFGP